MTTRPRARPLAPGASMRSLLLAALALAATGCALTSDPRPVSHVQPAGGRTLVVGVERDPANAQTVEDVSREFTFGLAQRGRPAVRLADLIDDTPASRAAAEPMAGKLRSGLVDEETAAWLRELEVRQLIFVEVKVYEQVWAADGKRTRVGLTARGHDLAGEAPGWNAYATPEVVDEPGRSFQLGTEAAVDALVRVVSGEPQPTRLPRLSVPYLPPIKLPPPLF